MASNRQNRVTIFPGTNELAGNLPLQSVPSVRIQHNTQEKAKDYNERGKGTFTTEIKGFGLLRKRNIPSDLTIEVAPQNQTKQDMRVGGTESVFYELPSKKYKKINEEKFGQEGTFPVLDYKNLNAKKGDSVLFIMKEFTRDNHAWTVQRIKHPRFLAVHDIFYVDVTYSIVFDHMPLSLFELRGLSPMDEYCLAAILGQPILDGFSYLEESNLGHGKLTCSNILIDFRGQIKIWGYEESRVVSDASVDIKALGEVTMELMHGYKKEDGVVGVDDLERWPSDSRAVAFLLEITKASKIYQLAKHSC